MTGLAFAIAAVAIAAAVGYLVGRGRRATIAQVAAEETLELLRTRQIAEDRQAARSLPPLVSLSDAYDHANRRGISVEDAAAELMVARARAIIDQRLREHRYRPGRPHR